MDAMQVSDVTEEEEEEEEEVDDVEEEEEIASIADESVTIPKKLPPIVTKIKILPPLKDPITENTKQNITELPLEGSLKEDDICGQDRNDQKLSLIHI